MSQYTEQAEKFMENCGATMTVTFLRHAPYFDGDTESRDIYHIVIKREGRGKDNKMEFDFGQSVAKSVPTTKNQARGANQKKRVAPTAYDVLSCLTKYEVDGDVWEFAREFGYEINKRESFNRVDKIHMAVIKEYRDVCRVFGDVLEQLCEIV